LLKTNAQHTVQNTAKNMMALVGNNAPQNASPRVAQKSKARTLTRLVQRRDPVS
jgi:hypothetical protein